MKSSIITFLCTLGVVSCTLKHSLKIQADLNVFQPFDSLTLVPSVEVYKLRHSIFRAERPAYGPMAKNNSKNVFSETAIGFDIGNHFFVDMNGNLSLRLDSILEMDTQSDFKLIKSNHNGLPIVYTKKGHEYKIRHHGLFHFEWKKRIQAVPHGYIFGRKHIQKKISFNESEIVESKGNRIHELSRLNSTTCSWLEGKKISYFYINDQTLLLPNDIRIVKSGSRLNYYIGASLKGYIQKSSDTLFIHEIGKKTYTLQKKEKALELWQSKNWLNLTYICYQ